MEDLKKKKNNTFKKTVKRNYFFKYLIKIGVQNTIENF